MKALWSEDPEAKDLHSNELDNSDDKASQQDIDVVSNTDKPTLLTLGNVTENS